MEQNNAYFLENVRDAEAWSQPGGYDLSLIHIFEWPPFAEFWQANQLIEMPENPDSERFIRFADFRRDPQAVSYTHLFLACKLKE